VTSRLIAVALVALALWAGTRILRQRRQRKLLAALRARWSTWRDRERDFTVISSYFRARAAADPPTIVTDDRTWADLNLDDVFAMIDRTESGVGQQVLYTRLRAAPLGPHMPAFEAIVERLRADTALRERVQIALATLSDADGCEIWSLAQPDALVTARWHVLFPIVALVMLGSIALVAVWPPMLAIVIVGAIVNPFLRITVAGQLSVVASAFRQIGPLLGAADSLRSIAGPDVEAITEPLRTDAGRLSTLRRYASWVGRNPSGGDLGSLVFEYLNLAFCLDANALFFGARELRARAPELLRVLHAVGEVDAAIAVASYRSGTHGWIRPVFIDGGRPASLLGLRHPLIPEAVPNSLTLCPPHGVIVTGSNMSGKSTFLRTVGVAAVLAQTINTCLADAYRAPVFVVRSCIGRADDPASGKSYYLVEVESVLDLVHAARSDRPHLILFDELFRGTNAVERIAAGDAVLVSLLKPGPGGLAAPHAVLAATHDQELVDLLAGVYAPFHFSDNVSDDGLSFDYQLRSGPATSRNAIAVLRLRGAPPDLVAHALARAEALDRSRQPV